jgi:hypothetical protein
MAFVVRHDLYITVQAAHAGEPPCPIGEDHIATRKILAPLTPRLMAGRQA